MSLETFYYDNNIVRKFSIATVIWGVIGMLVGVISSFSVIYTRTKLRLYLILLLVELDPYTPMQ